ncbi:hypothetical protein Tco_0709054 [Tanacetum coccineum]
MHIWMRSKRILVWEGVLLVVYHYKNCLQMKNILLRVIVKSSTSGESWIIFQEGRNASASSRKKSTIPAGVRVGEELVKDRGKILAIQSIRGLISKLKSIKEFDRNSQIWNVVAYSTAPFIHYVSKDNEIDVSLLHRSTNGRQQRAHNLELEVELVTPEVERLWCFRL